MTDNLGYELPDKDLIKGSIRINQKRYTDAYIDNPEDGPDIFIESRLDALDGDLVQVRLNPPDRWRIKHDAIVNKWDLLRDKLMPVVENLRKKSSQNSDQNTHDNQSNSQHARSKPNQNDQLSKTNVPLTNHSPASFKLPYNLPAEILLLKVEHVQNLNDARLFIQKTGVVVNIINRNNSGLAGGYLKPYSDKYALFTPIDSRKPRMLIDLNECPSDFSSQANRYSKILFVAGIYEWIPSKKYASGNLVKLIGDGNQVQSRMASLLMENQIIDEDFPPEVYQELEYLQQLPPDWFYQRTKDRRNLTNQCIVSIDPKTARDLDDAVSVKRISDDLYEVGVHIADVSFFVKEMSAVDYHARLRTTSVYLVDRVIPMLPRILCEQMCSLNPGEPKLAFSVIWKLRRDGTIVDEWFGRSVIKTCCKLAYEQAQDIIEVEGDISWIQEGINMPKLHGNFDWPQVAESIVTLNSIARRLRVKRFKDGALKIDQVKLKYELDEKSGLPTGFSFEERAEANCLIEEYMLLANMAVAKRIYKYSDEMAVLRRHPPSSQDTLKEVKEFCDAKGFLLDVSTAHSIQKSLNSITDMTISKVVSHLLLRTMKPAEYICVGRYTEDGHGFHHYALNTDFYTHFTSPIRRYADILVHRQLSIALGYEHSTLEDTNSLSAIATECTKRKISSKLISDTSQKLYFNLFVLKAGFCELIACVTKIYDHSFDVILVDYDRIGRVYLDKLKPRLKDYKFQSFSGIKSLELNWTSRQQENGCNPLTSKKKKKKAHTQAQSHLENGRQGSSSKHDDTATNEAINGIQTIEVFDLIKVIVTGNPNDITQLNIDLKVPSQ